MIGNDKLDRQLEPYVKALRVAFRDLLEVAR